MRVVRWLIFVCAVLASFYFGYATLYWAGLTATPLPPAGFAHQQRNVYVCLALTGCSFVGAMVMLVLAVRSARRGNRVGVVLWLIFVCAVLAITCFVYATLYWGAVMTATPVAPAGLPRARRNFSISLALAGCSFVGAMVALVFAVRSARANVRRGFEVLP